MSAHLTIVELTGADEAELRSWAEVTAASSRHEIGPHAVPWAAEELLVVARHHDGQRRGRFFAALLDGEMVGTGWLSLPLLDNLTSAEVDVHVRPDRRRQGIGSRLLAHVEAAALAEGRTRYDAEALWTHEGPADGAGTTGVEFARVHGYGFGLGDVQRTLPLPVPVDVLEAIAAEAAPHHAAYRLQSWSGPVPDRWIESWLEVAASLNSEAPAGAMEREAESVDVPAFRSGEDILELQGRTVWHTVALDGTDRVVGYTVLVLPSHDRDFVFQWGTLVRPEHRGHRLGAAIKVRNLLALQAGASAAELEGRRLVTWNAEVNDHMIAINDRLGFVRTARLGELQKKVAAPAPANSLGLAPPPCHGGGTTHREEGTPMTASGANDDLKAKMREALDRKNDKEQGVHEDSPGKEKAHGSEVVGGAPKMHRRKAGGGGS